MPILASGISVSPTRSILNTLPGQKLEIKYSLINQDQEVKKFQLEVAQLLGEDLVTDPKISRISWVSILQKDITLNSKATQEIAATINVPVDADAGSYRFIIVANEISAITTNNATGVTLAIGYPVEVNILKALPKANLKAFLDVNPSFSIENKFNASVIIKNEGNITLYPISYLKVFGPKGDIVYQETINAQQLALAPKNSNKHDFSFVVNLTNILNSTGEFTAELISLDNSLQISDKQTQSFVYIPAALALIASLLVLVGILLISKIVHLIVRKLRK